MTRWIDGLDGLERLDVYGRISEGCRSVLVPAVPAMPTVPTVSAVPVALVEL